MVQFPMQKDTKRASRSLVEGTDVTKTSQCDSVSGYIHNGWCTVNFVTIANCVANSFLFTMSDDLATLFQNDTVAIPDGETTSGSRVGFTSTKSVKYLGAANINKKQYGTITFPISYDAT